MTAAQPAAKLRQHPTPFESQFERSVWLILDKKITLHSRTTDFHNVSNKGRPSSVNATQFVTSNFLPFPRKRTVKCTSLLLLLHVIWKLSAFRNNAASFCQPLRATSSTMDLSWGQTHSHRGTDYILQTDLAWTILLWGNFQWCEQQLQFACRHNLY